MSVSLLNKSLSAQELAEIIAGTLKRGGTFTVKGVCTPEKPQYGCVCFLWDRKVAKKIDASGVCVVTLPELSEYLSTAEAVIEHHDPRVAYARFVSALFEVTRLFPEVPKELEVWVSPSARVHTGAVVYPLTFIAERVEIGKGSVIHPLCYIGPDTVIGENCVIYSGVHIYGGVQIGNNVIIHSGCVIGSDGFGFARQNGSGWVKIPHIGGVVIENDVELGACVTVDRGTIEPTVIGEGTKIDNLVQIAHNVRIGRRVVIAAQTGISGSAVIEDDATIGGQAGFVDRVKVGRGAMIAPQSGVHADIPNGQVYSGTPAIPHREWLKAVSVLRRLPEMREKIRVLENEVRKLKRELGNGK